MFNRGKYMKVMTEAVFDLHLNIVGSCQLIDGRIECDIESVQALGQPIELSALPSEAHKAIKQRLWSVALCQRRPDGDGESAVTTGEP
jgi:hypothetical protein